MPDMPPMPMMGDLFTILMTIFWFWMLVDCALNKNLRGKVFWILLILFTQVVGALIYFFTQCTRRNPVDAFYYYYGRITQTNRQNMSPPPRPPAPPMPGPYADYREGYRPPQAATPPAPPIQLNDLPQYQPQAEYEQPVATYPEMPPQQ